MSLTSLPRHLSEVDRLDLQHFALREALGANYVSPALGPASVIDVGCGTGQWATDLCEQFPHALVVGLDMELHKAQAAANYRFVRSNLLQGLPFRTANSTSSTSGCWGPGGPLKAWPEVVCDLVRVARPTGWIEVVEGEFALEPAGPATAQLFDLARQLAALMDLDTTGTAFRSLGDYLSRAGARNVQTQHVEMPVGERGAGSAHSWPATSARPS
jgi:trans-aconitate methyltransferase